MPEQLTQDQAAIQEGSIAESRDQIKKYPVQTKPFHLPEHHSDEDFAQMMDLRRTQKLNSHLEWCLHNVVEAETPPEAPVGVIDLPANRPDLYTQPTKDHPYGRVKQEAAHNYVLEEFGDSMRDLTDDFTNKQLPEAHPALRQRLLELVLATTPMMSQSRVNELLHYLEIGDPASPKDIDSCSNEELRARIDYIKRQLSAEDQSTNIYAQKRQHNLLGGAMDTFRTATRQSAVMATEERSTHFLLMTPTAKEKGGKGERLLIAPKGHRESEGIATLVMDWAVQSQEYRHSSRYLYPGNVKNPLKNFDSTFRLPKPADFLQLRQPLVTIYQGYHRSDEQRHDPNHEVIDLDVVKEGPEDAYEKARNVIDAAYLAVSLYEAITLRAQSADVNRQRSTRRKLAAVIESRSLKAFGERDTLVLQTLGLKRVLNSQLPVQLRLPLLEYIASDSDPRRLDVAAWSLSMANGTVTLRELVQNRLVTELGSVEDPEVTMSKEDRDYYQAVRQLGQRLLQYFDQVSESIRRAVGEISGESVSREMQDVIHQLFPEGNADHSRIVEVCDRLGVTEWSSGAVADIASALLIARAHGQPATLDNLTKEQLIEARLHPIFTGSTGDVRQSQYGVMLQNHDAQISLEDITSGTQAISPPEWDRDKTIEMMGGFNQLTLSNAVKPVTVTVGVATESRFVDPVLRTQEEVASPSSKFKWVPVGFSEIQSGIESLSISLDDIAALNDEDPRLLQFVRNVLRFSPRRFAPINEDDYVAVVNAQILAVISTFNVEHRQRPAELSDVDQPDKADSLSEVSNVAVQRLLQLILKAFRVARPYHVEEYSLSDEEYSRAFDFLVSKMEMKGDD